MTVALITGHGGFVGQHLTNLLTAEGVACHGFDLKDGHDIRSYEDVRLTVDWLQPDYIFHLAAQAYVAESVTDPIRAFDVNTLGAVNLLEACRQVGSHARIHLAGTSEEYGYTHALITEHTEPHPTTAYGASKLGATAAGLTYTAQYGLHVVITRAFNHTGDGQTSNYALPAFARRVVDCETGRAGQVVHGNLDAWRDFTDVRDVVTAYRKVIDCPPGVYNVCRGQSMQMSDYLDGLIAHAHGVVATKLDEHLHRKAPGNNFTAANAKLTAVSGWEPTVSVQDMLADLLDYWRERSRMP